MQQYPCNRSSHLRAGQTRGPLGLTGFQPTLENASLGFRERPYSKRTRQSDRRHQHPLLTSVQVHSHKHLYTHVQIQSHLVHTCVYVCVCVCVPMYTCIVYYVCGCALVLQIRSQWHNPRSLLRSTNYSNFILPLPAP